LSGGAKTESIEVDDATASALKEHAAQRGVTVAQFVSELAPLAIDDEAIAELDRRWTTIKRGQPTVPHAEVERWLNTWGSPEFRPWNER
jgi:predicted transcriptional regulator